MYTIFIVLVLYLLVPAAGISWFLRLRNQMISLKISNPPVIQFFAIYSAYGCLVVMMLTELLWKMSGLAVLGAAFSILVAPVAMGLVVYSLSKQRELSSYHRIGYWLGLLYFGILILIFLAGRILRG